MYRPEYQKEDEPSSEDGVDRIALEPASQRAARPPGLVVYAGFWRRVAAGIIDQVIVLTILFTIAIIVYYTTIYLVFIIFFAEWLYFAGMESSRYQATPGKMVMGIIVTDLDGYRISFYTATIRYFAKIFSGAVGGYGYYMIAISKRKQGLHDKVAECLVVVKAYKRVWLQQGMP